MKAWHVYKGLKFISPGVSEFFEYETNAVCKKCGLTWTWCSILSELLEYEKKVSGNQFDTLIF
jgi:hypothetical protein